MQVVHGHHLVAIACGRIASVWRKRRIFYHIAATLFQNGNKSLLLVLLVDISEIRIPKFHNTNTLLLFLHTSSHLYRPSHVFAEAFLGGKKRATTRICPFFKHKFHSEGTKTRFSRCISSALRNKLLHKKDEDQLPRQEKGTLETQDALKIWNADCLYLTSTLRTEPSLMRTR